jgi:hypothetical protein
MRVLVACEYSGVVRDAFKEKGHDAWSCDLLPTEVPGNHFQEDVRNVLDKGWDLLIAHPTCTYLSSSSAQWYYHPEDKMLPISQRRPHPKYPNRAKDKQEAIEFFMLFAKSNIPKVCIENPIGIMSTIYRKPDQIVHPYWFGEPHSKSTCLWLKNLPKLKPTNMVEPEFDILSNGKKIPKWYNLPPSADRGKLRSKTFQGIAKCMADTWG